jgi:hypothetical protein
MNDALIVAIAILHLAFIAFVAFGGLLVLRWRKLAWVHLPCAIWGAAIEIFRWSCPLTSVENTLRKASAYEGGFIARYLFGAIYPSGMTRATEIALAVFVTVINTVVYWRVHSDRWAGASKNS